MTRCKTLDYITAQEVADKWGVTRRYVQILCVNGRIEGAKKMANLWILPKNAEKPSDPRKSRKEEF
jgi:hypothetical protein